MRVCLFLNGSNGITERFAFQMNNNGAATSAQVMSQQRPCDRLDGGMLKTSRHSATFCVDFFMASCRFACFSFPIQWLPDVEWNTFFTCNFPFQEAFLARRLSSIRRVYLHWRYAIFTAKAARNAERECTQQEAAIIGGSRVREARCWVFNNYSLWSTRLKALPCDCQHSPRCLLTHSSRYCSGIFAAHLGNFQSIGTFLTWQRRCLNFERRLSPATSPWEEIRCEICLRSSRCGREGAQWFLEKCNCRSTLTSRPVVYAVHFCLPRAAATTKHRKHRRRWFSGAVSDTPPYQWRAHSEWGKPRDTDGWSS